jgi:hypothetical protein
MLESDAEEKAVAFVENLGGQVERKENRTPGSPVTAVDLYSTAVTDVGLKELASLKHLVRLDLSDTKITDAGA